MNDFNNLPSDTNQVEVDEDMEIEVTEDVIKIISGEENIEVKYDLTDKPTFTTEILVKNGMSYDDFLEEYNKVMYPMIGYMAVGNIQGAEFEDVAMYILMNLLGTGLSGDMSSIEYIVYDDAEGNLTPQVNENQKLIKQSEFGKYVMEYVNALIKEDASISDSEHINSYTWTVKQEDVTDSSCTLVSTISVDVDADFSKIEELMDEIEDSFTTNNDIISVNTNDKETNEEKNTLANIDTIPKAGTEFGAKNILQIIIFASVLSIIILLITSKKEK